MNPIELDVNAIAVQWGFAEPSHYATVDDVIIAARKDIETLADEAILARALRDRALYRSRVKRAGQYKQHHLHGPSRHVIPALGTMRRLRGLAVMGWDSHALAGRVNVHPRTLQRIRSGTQATIHKRVARAVALTHDELITTERPDPIGRRAMNAAAKHGWRHTFVWDDIDNPNELPGPAPKGQR